jgi:hypothetical protein
MLSIRGERQTILRGSNWDGKSSIGNLSNINGILTYSPGTSGGLFKCSSRIDESPAARNEYRTITRLSLKFGGQSSWSLSLSDGTVDVIIRSGTNEKDLVLLDRIEIAPYEFIKLVSAGASQEMTATLIFETNTLS